MHFQITSCVQGKNDKYALVKAKSNEAGKINVISDIIKRSILYLLEYFWDYCIVGILEVGDAITK